MNEAEIVLPYGPSGAVFAYQYRHQPERNTIEIMLGQKGTIDLHLLLPKGRRASEVTVGGRKVRFMNGMVEESTYVDAEIPVRRKNTTLVVRYR